MAATTTMIKPTLAQKLDMIPGLCSIVLAALYALLTGLWRSEKQPKTLTLHVGYAILRKTTARLSPLQLQLLMPPTNKIYELYAKKASKPVQSIELPHGVHGHWLGDKNAENVLIWYHGGGFALPANIGYFRFFSRTIADMHRAGKTLAVFCPTYTLTPHAVYPTQLRQAVECLRYILDTTSRKPANVFLGGDSAGGNLVGAVLSHLAHPHSQIDAVSLSENLGGAVLVSPWTSLETEYPPELIIDPQGDMITHAVGAPWGGAYIGTTKRDYYTDLSMAPTEWYKDFKVNSVLILGGEHEILLPVIEDFAAKFKDGFSNVEFFVGKRECHVASIYHLYLGDKTETETGKRMKMWLRELLN